MKYLIVQDWASTRGNHAGMEHMCDMLIKRYPGKYVKYVNPDEPYTPMPHNRILRKLRRLYDRYYYSVGYVMRYKHLCNSMFKELKRGDEVFLLEYLHNGCPQYGFAIYLRKKYPFLKLYALSHLTPSALCQKGFSNADIYKWSLPIDKMLTLGSSLSSYFVECEIPSIKISTGFHYVDDDYYHPAIIEQNNRIRILCLGAVQRNVELIIKVIKSTPQVDWIVCRGHNRSYDYELRGMSNVFLEGYVKEERLLEIMDSCDVSLNIMDDTIGSNVITTSMSMGLAIVVSDVGSIHDYCSEKNALFCDNTLDSFVNAINAIIEDSERLADMKMNSIQLSKKFHISNIDKWFSEL